MSECRPVPADMAQTLTAIDQQDGANAQANARRFPLLDLYRRLDVRHMFEPGAPTDSTDAFTAMGLSGRPADLSYMDGEAFKLDAYTDDNLRCLFAMSGYNREEIERNVREKMAQGGQTAVDSYLDSLRPIHRSIYDAVSLFDDIRRLYGSDNRMDRDEFTAFVEREFGRQTDTEFDRNGQLVVENAHVVLGLLTYVSTQPPVATDDAVETHLYAEVVADNGDGTVTLQGGAIVFKDSIIDWPAEAAPDAGAPAPDVRTVTVPGPTQYVSTPWYAQPGTWVAVGAGLAALGLVFFLRKATSAKAELETRFGEFRTGFRGLVDRLTGRAGEVAPGQTARATELPVREAELVAARAPRDIAQAEVTRLEGELVTQRAALQTAGETVARIEGEVGQMNIRLGDLQGQLAAVPRVRSRANNAERTRIEGEIDTLKGEIRAAQRNLRQARAEQTRIGHEVDQLDQQRGTADLELQRTQGEVARLEARIIEIQGLQDIGTLAADAQALGGHNAFSLLRQPPATRTPPAPPVVPPAPPALPAPPPGGSGGNP